MLIFLNQVKDQLKSIQNISYQNFKINIKFYKE